MLVSEPLRYKLLIREAVNEPGNSPGIHCRTKSRRNNLRAPLIVEKVPLDDGRKTFFGYAKNISCGGLFIGTVKPREPGELFKIEITLPTPDKLTFHCTCEVVWKRHFAKKATLEPGMGLKFLDLPEDLETKIDQWVRNQLEG